MAKIDTSLIDGYASMTPEQKLAALEAFEYDDNTAELERQKGAVTKANSEAAEWKRRHNALLSEDEQRKAAEEARVKELEEKYNALVKSSTIAEYTAKYVAMGYDAKLAADTAQAMVDGNIEKVFANNEKYKADLEKKIKADLVQDTPRPGADNGGKTLTIADISAIRDPVERQAAIAKNLELYGYKEM